MRVETHPVRSDPWRRSPGLTTGEGADLIVVGSRVDDGSRCLSSVPKEVMDRAECAVLIMEGVPTQGAASLEGHAVPMLGAVAGSCATAARESSQGRKAAALSGYGRVP